MSKILTKVQSREHSLFYAHVWSISNLEDFGRYTGENIKNILFLKKSHSRVLHVYYDKQEYQEMLDVISTIFSDNPEFFIRVKDDFFAYWEQLEPYFTGRKITSLDELEHFYSAWWHWWSAMAVHFVLPMSNAPQDVIDQALEVRKQTERYSDEGDRVFLEFFTREFPQYEKLAYLTTPEEVFALKNSDWSAETQERIRQRDNGYAFFNSSLYSFEDLEQELSECDLEIEDESVDEDVDELTGESASSGTGTGVVRVITQKDALDAFQENEILVAHMTSPDYVPMMKKAAAIVTDEGGVMCHAAIVSRELGKPCVIGTRHATQALKDGDEVEVDADKGVVSIIKKAGNE